MSKYLVVVESPAKQKTIGKILGKDYAVKSSFGHVRDLPAKELGIDDKKDFKPKYVVMPRSKKTIAELKKSAANCTKVYLAMDPDREGEAIAWHISEILKMGKDKVKRIFFHEITKSAIQKSFEHERDINKYLVDAQQARRILDRLVGYKLSPLLWKKITSGLSAGRVQSVAVRMLAERHQEILDFVEETYFSLNAKLKKDDDPKEFFAKLVRYKGEPVENTTTYKLFTEDYKVKNSVFKTRESLEDVIHNLKDKDKIIEKIDRKEVRQHPKPPFITSTLQQEGYTRLGFSSQKTMRTAQNLYEGINGESGLITYMRTDSFNVSKDLQDQTKKFIQDKYGSNFAPEKTPFYKTKSKGAQEAHESIHPTDVYKTPEKIKHLLTDEQYRLYNLIWLKFVASQMAHAVFDTVSVEIKTSDGICGLRASGRTVKFKGYLSVYEDSFGAKNEDEGNLIPNVKEGDKLELMDIDTKEHKTTPPPNYNEASLIKALEKHGIGRPSTYAPTIKTILDRKYIEKELKTKKLLVTDLGLIVTKQLVEFFQDIMNLSYTANIEEKLDDIAEGNVAWAEVIKSFYDIFTKDLDEAYKNMKKPEPEKTDQKCPLCEAEMVIRTSRFGRYMACSQFPKCKGKINMTNSKTAQEPEKVDKKCEQCGEDMVIKIGRNGRFLACSGYPNCRNTASIDKDGNIVNTPKKVVIKTDRKCDKCDKGFLVLRSSKKGEFLGCEKFPRCKNIVSLTEEEIAEIKEKHKPA
ncbi:MAG: type I DNA topoisomerase [Elusimicrobiaceae bacterium]|nr:type I DNA topoisomerase [Elusimicrobiaceae bacterium]